MGIFFIYIGGLISYSVHKTAIYDHFWNITQKVLNYPDGVFFHENYGIDNINVYAKSKISKNNHFTPKQGSL